MQCSREKHLHPFALEVRLAIFFFFIKLRILERVWLILFESIGKIIVLKIISKKNCSYLSYQPLLHVLVGRGGIVEILSKRLQVNPVPVNSSQTSTWLFSLQTASTILDISWYIQIITKIPKSLNQKVREKNTVNLISFKSSPYGHLRLQENASSTTGSLTQLGEEVVGLDGFLEIKEADLDN
jgi:hypothetical protein